jgi:hypothetical protein
MKKPLLISMIGFLTWTPVVAQTNQNGGAAQTGSETRKMSGKRTRLSGTVGTDGKTLTADNGRRIWMVSNPEALSGIDGRHVKVRALLDAALNQIRIMSVSAFGEERAGVKFGDAAFRR